MDIKKIVEDFVEFAAVFSPDNFKRRFDGQLPLADFQLEIIKAILVAAGFDDANPKNLDTKPRHWINNAYNHVKQSKEDAKTALISEIAGRQTPSVKIQVSEFQDFLITPKQDSIFSIGQLFQLGLDSEIPGHDKEVGIHATCEGTFFRHRRNQFYDSLVCKGDCGVTIPIRIEVKTYRDLAAELTREGGYPAQQ